MLYTPRRKYPYPASELEAGNGGLASELLARAVAQDLDALDAAWALEAQKSTKTLTLTANQAGISSGGTTLLILHNTIEKVTGTAFTTAANQLIVAPGGAGWYFVDCQLRAKPSGAVTTSARYRITLQLIRSSVAGFNIPVDSRQAEVYSNSATTTDVYNQCQGVFRALEGDRFWCTFDHTNAASAVTVAGTAGLGEGTRIQATRVCGL